jgi:hypothetical protein
MGVEIGQTDGQMRWTDGYLGKWLQEGKETLHILPLMSHV